MACMVLNRIHPALTAHASRHPPIARHDVESAPPSMRINVSALRCP